MLRPAEFDAGLFPSAASLKKRLITPGRHRQHKAVQRMDNIWGTAGWAEQAWPTGRLAYEFDPALRDRIRRRQLSEAGRRARQGLAPRAAP